MVVQRDSERFLIAVFIIAFVLTAVNCAWLCDDAYITFRTIDNFVNGYGLRWNVIERVQAYTHPLWMFFLTFFYFFTREFFYTGILVSLLVTTCAVALFACRLASTTIAALWGIVVFISSKAFIDFSSSGLENPLSYLLCALFLFVFLKRESSQRSLLHLSLCASLLMLNRLDLILILLPPLVYVLYFGNVNKKLKILLYGFLPFLLWEVFSLLYYGFLFPNTAYAKLNTGLPRSDLLLQGTLYVIDSLNMDHITLLVIFAAIVAPFLFRNRTLIPLALGIALYILYVIWIGGDFMSGRFFTVPLFCSVVLLGHLLTDLPNYAWGALFAFPLLLSLTSPHPPLLNHEEYGYSDNLEAWIDNTGIADERGVYYQKMGLLQAHRTSTPPLHEWVGQGRLLKYHSVKVTVSGTVGMLGYYAGPGVFIIDECALADPLLARLPAKEQKFWHVGHFLRHVPEGYQESLEHDAECITDLNLRKFYRKLCLITRGSLIDPERLFTIFKMNIGRYDSLIDRDRYIYEKMEFVRLSEINQPREQGTQWTPSTAKQFTEDGLEVDLGNVTHAARLEFSYDHNDQFQVVFLRDNESISEVALPFIINPAAGLTVATVEVPPDVIRSGYDKLRFFPIEGDGIYCIGHVRLIE
ncbi:MAG: hypothetical protein ACOX5R_10795 [bacterium]|jgi:arabinofuranosyltransferase